MQIQLPKSVHELIINFKEHNYEIYIVGGAVRDVIMHKQVYDWDFTTNAEPEQILAILPGAFYTNKFGTVGLPVELEKPFEITTYRTENGYTDSRRPDEVKWGTTLDEDLQRRDFTINAMALEVAEDCEPNEDANGVVSVTCEVVLIDKYDGLKDIAAKTIRTVGDPIERFSEDALRMMRAIRIAAEINFTIEEATLSAIKNNVEKLDVISKERVREELFKIIASSNPVHGIILLYDAGLLQRIIPELVQSFGVEQKSPGRHHIYDVGTHLVNSLKYVSERNNDPIVRLAALLHDIGKPQTFRRLETGTITFYNHEIVGAAIVKRIADRLKFSKEQKEKLWRLVRFHQFTVNEYQTDSALRRFIKNVTPELLDDMIDLRVADRLGSGSTETSWRTEEFKKRLVEVQKQPFAIRDLQISGKDIMEIMQIPPGPAVGEILNSLFLQVTEHGVPNEKEVLKEKVKEFSV
jgi:tRNA nucleotidyltransferase (CCA-adding enzyme)